MNQDVKGLAVWRTIYYLPAVVSGVAVSLLWIWILNPQFGVVNVLLAKVGIAGPQWLQSKDWALPSLVLMSLWGAGGSMVIYLAGLQGIPTDLYDAATIDGTTAWSRFRYITVPLMTPVLFLQLVTGIIGSFQTFTQGYVMTGGGPGHATHFYVLYLYQRAFEDRMMGRASAMAWVLFVIILSLTLLVFRTQRHWVYYEV
jgi:multiple sugar transport system permease protein